MKHEFLWSKFSRKILSFSINRTISNFRIERWHRNISTENSIKQFFLRVFFSLSHFWILIFNWFHSMFSFSEATYNWQRQQHWIFFWKKKGKIEFPRKTKLSNRHGKILFYSINSSSTTQEKKNENLIKWFQETI